MAILLVKLADLKKSRITILGPIFGSQKDPKMATPWRLGSEEKPLEYQADSKKRD